MDSVSELIRSSNIGTGDLVLEVACEVTPALIRSDFFGASRGTRPFLLLEAWLPLELLTLLLTLPLLLFVFPLEGRRSLKNIDKAPFSSLRNVISAYLSLAVCIATAELVSLVSLVETLGIGG